MKRTRLEKPSTETADRGRRSFFWRIGAGASAALASTAGLAGGPRGDADSAALELARLEEEKTLRRLHRSFEQAMNSGRHDEAVALFADDAEVVFNGGLFRHRSYGVSRLFLGLFRAGKSGKRIEPASGFEADAEKQRDSVEVAKDRKSAKAVFPYSIQVGKPLEGGTSLADMARLHGEGVQTWWEGGVYRVSYFRDQADGSWKISRLEYDTLSRADYRPGRSYAASIEVSPFATRYPEDQRGPDALVG